MQKILTTAITAGILSVGALLTTSANAITLTAPTGVRAAVDQTSLVQQTAHRHRGGHHRWARNRIGPRYSTRYYYGGYPYYYGYPYYGPYAYAPWRRPGVALYFRF
jgi:hypothetical protein